MNSGLGYRREPIRFLTILGLATLDLVLFPLRCLFYLFRRDAIRREILAALSEPSPAVPPATAPGKPRSGRPVRIFLSVGDISAEPHAVRLIQEVRARRESVEWAGFGGKKMAAAGCKILFDPIEMALFGFGGPARRIPAHLKALRRFLRLLREEPPDLVVLVDYPGFNLYLARAAKGRAPVLYYVCPQVWAWAPWRLGSFRASVDGALSILPFEAAFFSRNGVPARFVGHPIADHLAESDRAAAAPARGRPLLALLPGSRRKEIRENLPAMLRVAEALRKDFPEIQCVLPHEREDRLDQIREMLAGSPVPVGLRPGRLHETLREARLAFVKSGTAVLEVAHYEVPMLVFYKFADGIGGRMWEQVAEDFLITPYFASLNLLANARIAPEFAYSDRAVESRILEEARRLWKDGPEREGCIAAIRAARVRFDLPGAAARAAEILLERLPS